MSWLRFFRRRHADAEVQSEIESYLEEEVAENMARGMAPDRGAAAGADQAGKPATGAGDSVAAEQHCGGGERLAESALCSATPQTVTGIYRDGDSGDCAGNWGEYGAVHSGAFCTDEAAALPRSGEARGYCRNGSVRWNASAISRSRRGLLRLAETVPRL